MIIFLHKKKKTNFIPFISDQATSTSEHIANRDDFHRCASFKRVFAHFHPQSQRRQEHELLFSILQESLGCLLFPLMDVSGEGAVNTHQNPTSTEGTLPPLNARAEGDDVPLLLRGGKNLPQRPLVCQTIFSHFLARAFHNEGCKVNTDNSREAAWKKNSLTRVVIFILRFLSTQNRVGWRASEGGETNVDTYETRA